MARTVMAFRLMDRTVTQTDIAPSWISAVAMAPAVMVAMRGINMGLLSFEQKKTHRGFLRGGRWGEFWGG